MLENSKLKLENSQQALEYLLNHFLDIDLFPEQFTSTIVEYFKVITIDEKVKRRILHICDDYLLQNRNSTDFDLVLSQRANAIKQIISIEDSNGTSLWNNLIISEIDIQSSDIQKLNISDDRQMCDTQLSNLIIEEVDVADYIVM